MDLITYALLSKRIAEATGSAVSQDQVNAAVEAYVAANDNLFTTQEELENAVGPFTHRSQSLVPLTNRVEYADVLPTSINCPMNGSPYIAALPTNPATYAIEILGGTHTVESAYDPGLLGWYVGNPAIANRGTDNGLDFLIYNIEQPYGEPTLSLRNPVAPGFFQMSKVEVAYNDASGRIEIAGGDIKIDGTSVVGGGAADTIAYNDDAHPTITNVDAAIKELFGILEYVEPRILAFSMTPATTTYEIGSSVAGPLQFAWSYNKEMTSQTLTDCTLAAADRNATLNLAAPLTTNKSFTLSASDGKNSVSSTKSIVFQNKIYWGSAAEATYDSAFILALPSSKFGTARKGAYSMTVADNEYGYLAYPKTFGPTATVWIGGFEGTVTDCGEIEFTNASGHTETYLLYHTARPGLGAISMEVKS